MSHRLRQSWLLLAAFAVVALLLAPSRPRLDAIGPWPDIVFNRVAEGLQRPTSIANAGDGSGRLFIVEQGGTVRVLKNGQILATPFLDLRGKVIDGGFGGEQGMLGIAFPPGFAGKQYVYVTYVRTNDGFLALSRFRVNGDVALLASEEVVYAVEQPLNNHFGGQIAFSPRDGYLYLGLGDGNGEGDDTNLAQNPTIVQGKMLRLDTECCVGFTPAYQVPSTNPYVGQPGIPPEIWSGGFRNPWRFSFDRQTGDLYIADVGQTDFEEINVQSSVSKGGENYGWRIQEGSRCYAPREGCSTTGLTQPVVSYNHVDRLDEDQGCAVIGGYVYRGARYDRMKGVYFFTDFCNGWVRGLKRAGCWQIELLGSADSQFSTLGEDESGELFAASYLYGEIFELADGFLAFGGQGSSPPGGRVSNVQPRASPVAPALALASPTTRVGIPRVFGRAGSTPIPGPVPSPTPTGCPTTVEF